jgi:superfamily II DNA or RNA helicase
MKIIELAKPKLKPVKMNVDDIIDPKLEEFPAIKQCFGTSNTTLVCGGTGSGKTTWIIQMMKTIFKKVYHDIFLIMPENSMNSIADKDNVFKKYLDPENIYHTYDVETLQTIYDKIEDNASQGYYSLLLVDDFGNLLKSKLEAKILQSMFLKNRHLRLTAFVLCQSWYQVTKLIREITNNAILFNTSKSQNQKFFDEVMNIKKNDFDVLMKRLPTTHDYILVSLKHKKIYHNWDEIKFDD